jgi:hypothetical protein
MREYMIAVYDVTDFTEAERDGLAGELDAQADRSEHHPSTGIVVGTAEQAGDGVQHVGMFTEDDVEIGVVVKTSTVPTLDLTKRRIVIRLVANHDERVPANHRLIEVDDVGWEALSAAVTVAYDDVESVPAEFQTYGEEAWDFFHRQDAVADSSAAFAGAHVHTDQAAVLNLISRSDGIGLRQIADELNSSESSVRRKVIGLLHQEKIVLDGDVYRPA